MSEIFWLSVVQGVTEFLPISSSAHLVIFSFFFNLNSENLTLDISLHLGSLFAIVYFFRKEIFNFIQNKKLFIFIILSSLPTLILGYFLVKLNIIDSLRNIKIIGWCTLIFGMILYLSDLKLEIKKINNNLDFKSAIFIGFFQTFSLIPGVSRSGVTITAARFLSFKRTEAAKISFLLSIPTLAAISLYNIHQLIDISDYTVTIQNYIGTFLSFIFSFIVIKFFIGFLKKFGFLFFVIYRALLGIIILFYVYN